MKKIAMFMAVAFAACMVSCSGEKAADNTDAVETPEAVEVVEDAVEEAVCPCDTCKCDTCECAAQAVETVADTVE